MQLTQEQREGLGIALNEATLLGVELDPRRRIAGATFCVVTLPEDGPEPEDCRVQLIFHPVGRIAASLRNGRWDDPNAEVVSFGVEELLSVVQSFGGLPIYGWEYIDVHESQLEQWGDRISLDWRSGSDGVAHSIGLFQDCRDRFLDLCLWFDDLEIRDPTGNAITVESFIAGGKRWWDALYDGDKRTAGHGIVPVKGP